MADIPFYDARQIAERLDYPGCIEAMREAMKALSGGPDQPLRQVVRIDEGRLFGVMPGSLTALGGFGAKLVSVFSDPENAGRSRHQGVVVLYDADDGAVSCLADAEEITRIRTACTTAAATDALAREDASVLVMFGAGLQAQSHIEAIRHVRTIERVVLWGRSIERTQARAADLQKTLGLPVHATTDAQDAAGQADIICTVTSSSEPVLRGDWVRPGAHVNLVGSSYLGPVEADNALVAKSRYVADYRPSVLAQAAELAAAREAGVVTNDHVVGDIGQVFAGALIGRETEDQITLFKSLGHVVQDLAALDYVRRRTMNKVG